MVPGHFHETSLLLSTVRTVLQYRYRYSTTSTTTTTTTTTDLTTEQYSAVLYYQGYLHLAIYCCTAQ